LLIFLKPAGAVAKEFRNQLVLIVQVLKSRWKLYDETGEIFLALAAFGNTLRRVLAAFGDSFVTALATL
jgi:hypothetical protein